MRTRLPNLVFSALFALAASTAVGADNEGKNNVELIQHEDGTYTVTNPFKTSGDGSIKMQNGKTMSRKEVFETIKNDPRVTDWKTPDGRPINKNNVKLGKDGALYTKDGQRLSGGGAAGASSRPARTELTPASSKRAPIAPSQAGGIPDMRQILGGANQAVPADATALADRAALAQAAAAAEQPRGRPRSAIGGISLISGGQGKDGVAATGVIPVLK